MAIQDTDPSRRNLTVTSIAFIVYSLAGGSFTNNEIRLQMINMNFSNPEFLVLAAWVSLLWFAFRYWQTRELSLLDTVQKESSGFIKGIPFKILKTLINKSFNCNDKKKFNHIHISFLKDSVPQIQYSKNKGISSLTPIYKPTSKTEIVISWATVHFEALISKAGIIDYVFPYLLFLTAVFTNI